MSVETEMPTIVVPDTIEEIERCCEAVIPSTCDAAATWLESHPCPKCGHRAYLFCDVHYHQSVAFWTQKGWQPVHNCGSFLHVRPHWSRL